jgi:hypothetical protein
MILSAMTDNRKHPIKVKCVRNDGTETELEYKDAGDIYIACRKTDVPWKGTYPLPEPNER